MSKAKLVCVLAVLVVLVACGSTVLPPTIVPTEPPPAPTAVPLPTATPTPEPTQESRSEQTPIAVIPPYVFQIGVWDASGEFYGRGSTFLVDTDMRLFATNAHVTEGDLKGKLFRIQIGGVWYPAHTEEAWINWHADGAIFRLEAPEDLVLPESARLGDTLPKGSDVWVMGYLADPKFSHMPDAPLIPYSVEAFVVALDSGWAVTPASWEQRALLMDAFIASLPEGTVTFEIPRAMRNYYYRHFVMIMQKELTYEQRFRPGTSGMPLLGEGGEVVGMLAAFVDPFGIFFGDGGNAALAIPAGEIKKLRDKVIGMLK